MAFQLHRGASRLLLLLTVLMLSACGFHLRSAPNLPFESIFFEGIGKNTPLGVELRRNMNLSGVSVVDKAKDAEVILQMLADGHERKIEALDTSGNVRVYSLYERFRYQLKDNHGVILIPPAQILIKRSITYDPNQELAKQTEEGLIYREMQRDIVQQLLRRLAAAKLKPGSDTSEVSDVNDVSAP